MQRYLSPIKWLGGFALLFLLIGLIFPSLTGGITDQRVRDGVLVNAVPFVTFFIMVLLLYILVIVLVAKRFNGRLPNRAHQPVETLAIAGILFGVIFLFQPFFFVSYRYGFVLLLASTLVFILWSHIAPKSAKADRSDLGVHELGVELGRERLRVGGQGRGCRDGGIACHAARLSRGAGDSMAVVRITSFLRAEAVSAREIFAGTVLWRFARRRGGQGEEWLHRWAQVDCSGEQSHQAGEQSHQAGEQSHHA